ncbi:class I SAM-dependent methyltransferase [Frankia sp. CNm7]|uniref:Class I SAM-dependent methyltransferase n=1 Tax=Frankia nepalensis TaxID=1836974 RepID=A0A937ULK2_9ACTN|nr:class I SAM-dependent methyltransferase [Frankia nepalensis]MBL7498141.1 class I SAM-dependent methyltransferase [Frankia nepalensis]MBL7509341.1 class I SAM-dependent methyltransferase [Frankia nepalensis]MBL7516871.1 class I SAM-dependent methyltransferase [Frankia nepalensis]MBL7627929.1 class I SAM-dependent methyltransferase [Frankia nepalensis]
MGFYDDRVLPRLIDVVLGRPVEGVRARVAANLSGEVLEIGFGSGRNVPHLPPAVDRLMAVEPAAVGRGLAAKRIAEAAVPVDFVGDDGQRLALPDESVDNVLVTWTLCTIPDVARALAEVRRVLRPGGSLHFVEHGRSPNPRVARRQDRLDPYWGKIAGGCHLNRPIAELVERSGLTLATVTTYRLGWPELTTFAYEGVASKRA